MKRTLYRSYSGFIRAISRTSLPRIFSQAWRHKIGKLLRLPMRPFSRIDSDWPYQVLGHTMFLHPTSANLAEMVYETYELDTVKVIESLLSSGMTFVDVGAYVGYYTLLAARLVGPNCTVYAFEPQPDVYELLVRNIHMNGYSGIVISIQKAVTDGPGSVVLYESDTDSGETSLFPNSRVSKTKVKVESVSLDDFFREKSWPSVHLIKLDIEGAESFALKGMRDLSRRNPDLRLIVEYNSKWQNKAGVTPEQFFAVLQELGFSRFYAIHRGRLFPIRIPVDISWLLRMTNVGNRSVNLLTEK